MIPIAGSAYTYAYATLGELVAWMIGWDLILECGVGATAETADTFGLQVLGVGVTVFVAGCVVARVSGDSQQKE